MSILKTKLPKYLKELAAVYERQGEPYKHSVIANCRWAIRECTHYDNLDGGMDGHTIILFAPIEFLASIKISERNDHAREIASDLRDLSTAQSEFVAGLHIEAEDEEDPEYQGATPLSDRPVINPDSLSIWKPGLARVFISHRDKHKAKVQELGNALEAYGMSCFVAHETIPADEEWQKTIVNGLETMELMVAVLTDDFHESVFCMQEVGYALGRSVPVISLKVGSSDPVGFTSHKQAQRGSLDEPLKAAKSLFPIIGDRLRRLERLNDVLVNSFCDAQDWYDARERFDRIKSQVERLTPDQTAKIVASYASNDQLHNAIYLNNNAKRLVKYMNSATDGDWIIERTVLKDATKKNSYDDLDEDIPF